MEAARAAQVVWAVWAVKGAWEIVAAGKVEERVQGRTDKDVVEEERVGILVASAAGAVGALEAVEVANQVAVEAAMIAQIARWRLHS